MYLVEPGTHTANFRNDCQQKRGSLTAASAKSPKHFADLQRAQAHQSQSVQACHQSKDAEPIKLHHLLGGNDSREAIDVHDRRADLQAITIMMKLTIKILKL